MKDLDQTIGEQPELFHSEPEKRERPPDLSWEALVEECSVSLPDERGQTNAALRSIRQHMGDEADETVATEIRKRARRYRLNWPGIALTPTALAKHWYRVSENAEQVAGVNLHGSADCEVCSGDHFLEAERDGREVMVPCPECGPILNH